MNGDYWKNWLAAAGMRALKTFTLSMAGGIAVGAALIDIDWKYAASVAAVSAILSVFTSLAGLPEVDDVKIYRPKNMRKDEVKRADFH